MVSNIRSIMEIQDIISELSGDISMFDTILAYVKRAAAKGDEILQTYLGG